MQDDDGRLVEAAVRGMMGAEEWSTFWSSEDAAKLVRVALSAIEREGWKVVPVEPTQEMREAGAAAAMKPRMHVGHTRSDMGMTVAIGYAAMLSAAPKRG